MNSILIKFFCAVTETLNDYISSISETSLYKSNEEILKNLSESSFQRIVKDFTFFQSKILETVQKMQTEDSISFEFSDQSDSPSPTKNFKPFKSPPLIKKVLLEENELKWKTEPKSRLKKLENSKSQVMRKLFKD
jgi:hypothetical protein